MVPNIRDIIVIKFIINVGLFYKHIDIKYKFFRKDNVKFHFFTNYSCDDIVNWKVQFYDGIM